MKKKKAFWAVMVGKGHMAYPMDGKLFERRKDAKALLAEHLPCSWSHIWHIEKLEVVS
jgi:hypothetical protein